MYHNALKKKEKIFAVAPMMDWTDRHCRYFHRQMTRRALLYTEMVVADAIIHGDRDRHLAFDDCEHPVALQLGGSEPEKLARAVRLASDHGYDEINLNAGCPSDRVQSGTFGACLMREPELVARCVAAMKAACDVPVTVKCRIGVDEQDEQAALDALASAVWDAGCDALWVHARKAWLEGLSPKENRDIPPLNYERVYRLKQENPDRFIGINGGIDTLEAAELHLDHVDGVMLGRAAYHNPQILLDVDNMFHSRDGGRERKGDIDAIMDKMVARINAHVAQGGRAHHVTRHMVGMFSGQRGARRYRQVLSSQAQAAGADGNVLKEALACLENNVSA